MPDRGLLVVYLNSTPSHDNLHISGTELWKWGGNGLRSLHHDAGVLLMTQGVGVRPSPAVGVCLSLDVSWPSR